MQHKNGVDLGFDSIAKRYVSMQSVGMPAL